MKKLLACLLAALLFALSACAAKEKIETPDSSVPPETPTQTEEPAKESAAPKREVTLYLPNDNADGFDTETAEIDDTPDSLVEALIEAEALPEGSELLDYSPAEDRSTAVLNMNQTYGTAVSQTGTAGEYMLIGSLVDTFLTNYGLDSVSVIIDGKTLETGHNVYDYELTFYE